MLNIFRFFLKPKKTTICLFGDSIVAGEGDNEPGGWGTRLQRFFDANGHKIKVVNRGVGGNTTDDLVLRFEKECRPIKPDMVIFGIGINDTKYMGKSNPESIIPINRLRENIQKLIDQAKKITQKVIFIGPTTVDESKTMPCIWDGVDTGIFFDNKRIALYSSKIREVCEKNDLDFINMLDLLNTSDTEDGLHPDPKGYEKMFLRIKENVFKKI